MSLIDPSRPPKGLVARGLFFVASCGADVAFASIAERVSRTFPKDDPRGRELEQHCIESMSPFGRRLLEKLGFIRRGAR